MPSSACKKSARSEEHTSELQSHDNLVCRLLLEKKTRVPLGPRRGREDPVAGQPPPGEQGQHQRDEEHHVSFFLMIRGPPRSPLFPYTPLFRSLQSLALVFGASPIRRSHEAGGHPHGSAERSEEHTSELQSHHKLVSRLPLA